MQPVTLTGVSCQIGYLLSTAKTCVNCNTKFVNCQLCSESVCNYCLNGFYINSGVCLPCSSTVIGCATCYNSISCGQCKIGYYLQANSTCAFCPLKCKDLQFISCLHFLPIAIHLQYSQKRLSSLLIVYRWMSILCIDYCLFDLLLLGILSLLFNFLFFLQDFTYRLHFLLQFFCLQCL